ncbi:MAG: hypothetical protein JWN00_6171 [Actinomycetia bacterium]|nr:hypothetical protein [Actinomycetes bacterium]
MLIAAAIGGLIGAVMSWIGYRELVSPGKYHGTYLSGVDFDGEARGLLGRAKSAVIAVLESEVHKHGLLDGIANRVLLPQQLWDVAQVLRTQTTLRAEQQHADQQVMTPELKAVIGPQRRVLERSAASVTRQIEALEEYASRVAKLESAFTARTLLDGNDKYRALLAATHDEESVTELSEGTRSLRDAVEAGQMLALPCAVL